MIYDAEYVAYIQDNVLDDIPEEGIGSDTLVMPYVDSLISLVLMVRFDCDIHSQMKIFSFLVESTSEFSAIKFQLSER